VSSSQYRLPNATSGTRLKRTTTTTTTTTNNKQQTTRPAVESPPRGRGGAGGPCPLTSNEFLPHIAHKHHISKAKPKLRSRSRSRSLSLSFPCPFLSPFLFPHDFFLPSLPFPGKRGMGGGVVQLASILVGTESLSVPAFSHCTWDSTKTL
jgi:hypothetical protein